MNEKLSITQSNPIKARFYDYEHFFYPWHFHHEYEILFVKESFGQCYVGDTIEKYYTGDIFLFGSALPHYMSSDPVFKTRETSLRVKGAIVRFEKEFMSYSIGHYPQFLAIRRLLEESRRGIRFPWPANREIVKMVEQIPLLSGLEQLTSVLLLLQKMAQSKSRKLLASPHFYDTLCIHGNTKIEKILSYLNKHYTRPISLEEIASLAAMNPTAFCRYFKEKTGRTFKQYIIEMRIGYARKLLLTNDLSISQISAECGFESVTHFNRIFKRLCNLTPSEYREKMDA
ncbi:MAG: AraC family transcriptional regulator [Bacteroides sp.]|nr:AraC family transcriptional regulator [Bacteroides sp.]